MVVAASAGLAAVLVASTPALAAADDTGARVDAVAVDRVVKDFADKAGYPGIAVAITKGDQVQHVAGYGRDATGAATTATTPMPVASVSKSFTALAVMQLVEQGKVMLDAPAHQYVPEFHVDDPRGGQITIRELLSQTSGITDRTLQEKSLPQPDSLKSAVERAHAATLATDPGTRHAYTNTNYHLAARLVEVVSGQPFAGYLHDHVFGPLGMRASVSIDQTPANLPDQVRMGHMYAYGATIAATEPKRFVAGSDGVITTAQDMAQWLIMQSNGGTAANGTRLASAQSITAMHTSSDPRWTYGMGWDRDDKGWVRHSGVWFTYTASQLLLPSGYGIAVLGNSGIGLGNEGTDQLADALADLVTGGAPTPATPIRLIIDLVLGGLTLISLALGVRNLRRTSAWARRRADKPLWLTVARLAPRIVPAVLLVSLPDLLGLAVGGGRDVTFLQVCYYSLPLVAWATVAGTMNLCVLASRAAAMVRLRRSSGRAVAGVTASAEIVAGVASVTVTSAKDGWLRRSPVPPWALIVLVMLSAVIVVEHGSLLWWGLAATVLAPLAAAAALPAYPIISLGLCAAASLTAAHAMHSSVPVWSAALAAALFVISLLAGRRIPKPRPALATLGAAAGLNTAFGLVTGTGWGTGLLVLAMGVALPWAVGRMLRQQDQLVAMTAEQARLQERTRIAHDMHDTLGHDLSVLALRAAALEIAPDLDDQHRVAAAELRAGAATATERLAEIITVLRDDAQAPLQPASDRADDLVDRARQAGMTVALTWEARRDLPTTADRAVHRIIQEALTNAMKHAPGAPVNIDLVTTDATTTVTIINPLPSGLRRGQGSRAGLASLRERVRLAGGTLRAGPAGHVFEVVAVLPHMGQL